MDRIKHQHKLPSLPRPCEIFDVIGGVGTGGCVLHFFLPKAILNPLYYIRLIALMLGRLEMPIDIAIKEYGRFSARVFSDEKLGRSSRPFKASTFEAAIKDLLKSLHLDPDSLIMAPSDSSCCRYVHLH